MSKKVSNPNPPERIKRPPPPPAPPPKRVFKEIFLIGLIETNESKQRTHDWNNSLVTDTEK